VRRLTLEQRPYVAPARTTPIACLQELFECPVSIERLQRRRPHPRIRARRGMTVEFLHPTVWRDLQLGDRMVQNQPIREGCP